MLTTRMQPNGSVELPEEVRSFFAASGTIDVTQHKSFIGLWRPWSRVKGRAQQGERTGALREDLLRTADRHYTASRYLLKHAPLSALYLSGYSVECRLKALVCRASGWENLERASYELSKRDGEEYQLVGADGHNLELLVDLVELRAELRSMEDVRDGYAVVNRWQVGWRYAVPSDVAKDPQSFFDALDTVVGWLKEVN